MLALLYIFVISLFGCALVRLLVPNTRRLFVASAVNKKALVNLPDLLFVIPAGIIIGILVMNLINYILLYGVAKVISNHEACKNIALLMTSALALYFTVVFTKIRHIRSHKSSVAESSGSSDSKIPQYNSSTGNLIFYGSSIVIFTLVAAFLYFYTYRLSNGTLCMGYSVFSDLSPHTSMISSFGVGFNIPTHYMHFADDGIQYHFLFYYFCGMLQYLGLSIDYALNIASIISMVCSFMLLGLLAMLLSGRRLSFVIAPVLVLFRSSFNVFYQLYGLVNKSHFSLPNSLKLLAHATGWSDVTPYDSWGIWAINVYANQRHLMFGIALTLILILLFLPYVRRMSVALSKCECFSNGLKYFLFAKNSWGWRSHDSLNPLGTMFLSALIAGFMPYYHGSCLIAALLILFGMAIVSESRLIYLFCAGVAVGSSFLQTHLFSGSASDVVDFKINPGFVLGKVPASQLVSYIVMVTGLTLILALITMIILIINDIYHGKPVYRFFLGICFCLPGIFAFLFQLTSEVLANHKFIQISLILLDTFVALLLCNLFKIPFNLRGPETGLALSSDPTNFAPPASINEESFYTDFATSSNSVTDAAEENESLSLPQADTGLETDSKLSQEVLLAAASDKESVPKAVGEAVSVEVSAPKAGEVISETISGEEIEAVSEAVLEKNTDSTYSTTREVSLEDISETTSDSAIQSDTDFTPIAIEGNPHYIHSDSPAEEAPLTFNPLPTKKRGLTLPQYIAIQTLAALLALILLVPLLGTGISEWCVYRNLNKWHLDVNTKSELVEWIVNNTGDQDVFLTPEWSINRFNLTGRAMYYGWPYYAWSAGHDTFTRDEVYRWLVSGCGGDAETFINYCKSRNIRYLIADPEFNDFESEIGPFNWEFFAENLTQVAYFTNDHNTIVYKIY